MMGKRALISGTGTGLGPEATVTGNILVEPIGIEANWTVGTDTKFSSKVEFNCQVATVAHAEQAVKAPTQQRMRRVLPRKRLVVNFLTGLRFCDCLAI